MTGAGRAAAGGAALAALSVAAECLLPAAGRRPAHAGWLVLIAGVYPLTAGRRGPEVALAAPVVGLAAVGLWAAPAGLAAGYLLQACEDLLHHRPRLLVPAVPGWYPPLCMVYDLGMAAWVAGRVAGALPPL